MTIDARCIVCKSPDRRRLVELGWNGGMTAAAIARVLSDTPGLSPAAITTHLKAHADGDARTRAVMVDPERPVRERVLDLQRLQLDEFERRVAMAQQRAVQLNAALDQMRADGVEGAAETPYHDWSEFFDINSKEAQAAIGSILKAQGLNDKRDAHRQDLKLGLFEAMAKNGLAPKGISGAEKPALPAGEEAADGDD